MKVSGTKVYAIALAAVFSVFTSINVAAQSDDDKAQLENMAVDICQNTAQQRYGENSIKSVSKKAKWSKGLKGAAVKMKIKPESKRSSKYQCVVSLDKTVTFYKS